MADTVAGGFEANTERIPQISLLRMLMISMRAKLNSLARMSGRTHEFFLRVTGRSRCI